MTQPSLRPYSASRIAQPFWFVVSVYFGLMIGETTKEGLTKSVLSNEMDPSRLWIIVPTLIFYFFSVAEAYLWLNPRDDEKIKTEEAVFRGLHLLVYLVAILAQAFLMRASNDVNLKNGQEFVLWSRAFAGVLVIYALYNVVWMVRRLRWDSSRCPSWRLLTIYTGHYLGFGLVFLGLARFIERHPSPNSHCFGLATAFLFACYLVTYLIIWWKRWHKDAISAAGGPLY